MTMPKFATNEAESILGRLDKIAGHVQANYAAWGMPFDVAREIVNTIDKTADAIELASFDEESLVTRQMEVLASTQAKTAQVHQQDSDEAYMKAFQNPMAPVQVESDEAYMKAFSDDQSSGMFNGKATNGRPLAP